VEAPPEFSGLELSDWGGLGSSAIDPGTILLAALQTDAKSLPRP